MDVKRIGELVFLGAVAVALVLYGLTVPGGLPWNASTQLAAAYVEATGAPLPHPFWGFHVEVFGGSVALSVFCAALAAGLLGALVSRYFGWRFAVVASVVWVFMPGVWNRAITGERSICLASMAVVALWVLNAVALRVTRRARAAKRADATKASLPGHDDEVKREKRNRLVGWSALGAAGVFVLASLTFHDYQLGEAASVYARGVVEAAGERVIVMNGVCDEQVIEEVKGQGSKVKQRRASGSSGLGPPTHKTVSLRNDDAYRSNLVAWVRSAFPTDTNLWVAAQVSPQAFVDAAVKRHPERFYLMNGTSTTLEQWENRWEAFKPYLESEDRFVRVGRRLFAYEGNAVANAMLEVKDATDASRPWQLYKRIHAEIDPGNFSALVNMSEMIRRGHAVSGEEKRKVQEKLETFFKDLNNRKHCREIVRAAGPIRADPALMEKMAKEAKKRNAERVAAGEKEEVSPEILSLVEWNNEMVALMDKGEIVKAGRIARAILSNPKWRGFIPANATMGVVAAKEGDYVASERFFQVATDTTNAVPSVVLNDYADTLVHRDRLGEAEKIARRAVRESDETFWLARLTLAEVLEKATVRDKGEREEEIRALLKSVLRYAPAGVRDRIRKAHKNYVR